MDLQSPKVRTMVEVATTLTLALLLTLTSVLTAFAQSAEPAFFGVNLEPPVGRVLNGWGQFSSEWALGAKDGEGDAADLASYERAMSPNLPALLSFYTALDQKVMPQFVERYKSLVVKRGFFVSEVGINFQTAQRDTSIGMRDPEIVMLMDTLRETHNPALLRIGYEFNNPWATYDPSLYIQAFRKVIDRLREAQLDNVATVWNATAAGFDGPSALRWYPGDNVVDWWGVNLFDLKDFDRPQLREFLDAARRHRKPVIICEASPVFQSGKPGQVRGPKSDAEAVAWFEKLAGLINDHQEIQAVALISVDWRRIASILPGSGWPDARIQRWPKAAALWKKTLSKKRFINASEVQTIYLLQGPGRNRANALRPSNR